MTRNVLFTLTKAAEETGLARSTIFNAIKYGKVSATRDEHNRFVIDPAELFRVYPRVNEKTFSNEQKNVSIGTENVQNETGKRSDDAIEIESLRKQLELTERLLAKSEMIEADLRKQIEQLCITHQPTANASISEPTESKLLLKLFGKIKN